MHLQNKYTSLTNGGPCFLFNFSFLGRPSRKHMGGIPFSLKLEGQDWQCIFHAFPLGAGQITHALPLGAGRHGFSYVQFIMED